jgi:hypothetical protein
VVENNLSGYLKWSDGKLIPIATRDIHVSGEIFGFSFMFKCIFRYEIVAQ